MHIAGVKNSEQKQDNVFNPSYSVRKSKKTDMLAYDEHLKLNVLLYLHKQWELKKKAALSLENYLSLC